MFLKVHAGQIGEVVALCDAELIGRRLTEGKIVLDLSLYADFYKGEKVTADIAIAALMGAQNANLVGKKSLEAARAAGLDTSGAIAIDGVPHLQLYRI